ncbi:MAG: carbonic anhydrase [Alphaproteobacteria bacterium]|nr:carbonic anhydrase [Rhodospirillales bacterium]MCW9045337.1 carbonic anhydrase [Alphaproteobacteria bacterium]
MSISHLKEGFMKFHEGNFKEKSAKWEDLVENGQHPKIAVVACSDSRIDPAFMMNAEPGEIFVIRNVANLVPPYDDTAYGYHGTSAALEYAAQHLKVTDIIVLGHAYCGGIGSLFAPKEDKEVDYDFISPWMTIAEPAHRRVVATMPNATDSEQARACEKGGVMVSLENLMTFSCIREKVFNNELRLHGWMVDIRQGTLSCYNAETNQFEEIKK